MPNLKEKKEYQPRLLIHFMRHAESDHKSGLHPDPENLSDPALSVKGTAECVKFAGHFRDAKRITHVLCSPMLRSRQTAVVAFSNVDPAVVDRIVALPHLQTIGDGPNNTGASVKKMKKHEALRSRQSFSKGITSIPMDVATFCDQSWTQKEDGRWSAAEITWRLDFMRGLLSGIWIGCGMRRAEVAVVTHGSFLRSFLEDECFSGLHLTTCVLDELSNLKKIDESELHGIRAATDQLSIVNELPMCNSNPSIADEKPCRSKEKVVILAREMMLSDHA